MMIAAANLQAHPKEVPMRSKTINPLSVHIGPYQISPYQTGPYQIGP